MLRRGFLLALLRLPQVTAKTSAMNAFEFELDVFEKMLVPGTHMEPILQQLGRTMRAWVRAAK